MAHLKLENLTVGYGGMAVAKNISLTVNKGDFVCVIGDNGSGKTTLMKTVLGLLPPISGKVSFCDGFERSGIGYMPQIASTQRDFPASVGEVVLSGCVGKMGFRPFYSKAEKAAADAAMEQLGIKELKRKCYRELSGGQQKRVLLARALCAANDLILLDEPAAGLDSAAEADMYSLIHKINGDGTTVIMILHDVDAALRYASHILHIGDELYYKTVEQYKNDIGGGENE